MSINQTKKAVDRNANDHLNTLVGFMWAAVGIPAIITGNPKGVLPLILLIVSIVGYILTVFCVKHITLNRRTGNFFGVSLAFGGAVAYTFLAYSFIVVILNSSPTPIDAATEIVKDTATQIGVGLGLLDKLVITEIASGPSDDFEEFVEICNYGETTIDTNGLFLANSRAERYGNPVVSWDTSEEIRGFFDGEIFVTNSSILEPGHCGVILSPNYRDVIYQELMPTGTIILTVGNGDFLGSEKFGIVATGNRPSAIIVYRGDPSAIDTVLSSYGVLDSDDLSTVKTFSDSVQARQISGGLPFPPDLGMAYGVVRKECDDNDDVPSKWKKYYEWTNSTPGACSNTSN